jgi:hypothetical protein
VIAELLQKRCGVGSLAEVFPGAEPAGLSLAAAK